MIHESYEFSELFLYARRYAHPGRIYEVGMQLFVTVRTQIKRLL